MFLLIPLYRQKLLRGSNNVVTGFRTFIYGVLALVTWPLSFQWCPIIPRPQAHIRRGFRTCRAFLT